MILSEASNYFKKQVRIAPHPACPRWRTGILRGVSGKKLEVTPSYHRQTVLIDPHLVEYLPERDKHFKPVEPAAPEPAQMATAPLDQGYAGDCVIIEAKTGYYWNDRQRLWFPAVKDATVYGGESVAKQTIKHLPNPTKCWVIPQKEAQDAMIQAATTNRDKATEKRGVVIVDLGAGLVMYERNSRGLFEWGKDLSKANVYADTGVAKRGLGMFVRRHLDQPRYNNLSRHLEVVDFKAATAVLSADAVAKSQPAAVSSIATLPPPEPAGAAVGANEFSSLSAAIREHQITVDAVAKVQKMLDELQIRQMELEEQIPKLQTQMETAIRGAATTNHQEAD